MYLAIPTGKKDLLRFNAHRFFNPNTIIESVPDLELEHFLYLNDWKLTEIDLKKGNNIILTTDETCGIFIFRKGARLNVQVKNKKN